VSDYEAAAWSWVDHLSHGGTTPWTAWRPPPGEAPKPRDTPLPGAAQLEFVRRCALAAPSASDLSQLAELVLSRTGPGRGQPELPLPWPDRRTGVGPPPRDPATLPLGELARVGTGVLAELLLADDSPAPPPPNRRHRRLWSKPFHLEGAPVTVEACRTVLAAAGHLERGDRPEVVLVARPLDRHLFEVWSSRVARGAPVRWDRFVSRCQARDELPPSADLVGIARHWRNVVGPERVHLLVDPMHPVAAVSQLLDVRTADALPPSPGATGVDVLRRVNGVLAIRTDEARRAAARARMLPLLGSSGVVSVPEEQRAWVAAKAVELADALAADGYADREDLDRLGAAEDDAPSRPSTRGVLDLIVGACLLMTGTTTQRREDR